MLRYASGAPCNVDDGSAFSTEACSCGDVHCTVDTGLICYSTTGGGSCRKSNLGPFGYPKVNDGSSCNAVVGRGSISNLIACGIAADSLGLNWTRSILGERVSSASREFGPRGCFLAHSSLYFKGKVGQVLLGETRDGRCTPSETCICVAGVVPGDCGADAVTVGNTSNCNRTNQRCQCVQCNTGYYTSDCSKMCPPISVSITTDLILFFFGLWIFLAFLYYMYREVEETNIVKDAQNTANDTKGAVEDLTEYSSNAADTKVAAKAAKLVKLKLRSLQRLVISRMQILASILVVITWSPDMPKFLINLLSFIANIFTINVPGLLSSIDCMPIGKDGEGMTPLNKWFFRLFFPLVIVVFFAIWHRCLARNSVARNTVGEAAVQVWFVWLFNTIVTSSLQVLDCDGGTEGKLIMDPSMPCPLGGASNVWDNANTTMVKKENNGNVALALLGMCVLFLYISPYWWLLWKQGFLFVLSIICPFHLCCCCCFDCHTRLVITHHDDNFVFIFGWALENFKDRFTGWEIWNVFSRTLIIVASTMMYSENRFITHIVVMSWSLLLHVRFRPYINAENNIVAILFGLCDILGALSAVRETLQTTFVLSTLITLVVIGIFVTRAILKQAAAVNRSGLTHQDTSMLFAAYTSLEKKLLFPILAVVLLAVKLYQTCCRYSNEKNTVVVPRGEEKVEEKVEEKEDKEEKEVCTVEEESWDI